MRRALRSITRSSLLCKKYLLFLLEPLREALEVYQIPAKLIAVGLHRFNKSI